MQRLLAVAALTEALALGACSAKPEIVIANADQVVIVASSAKARLALPTPSAAGSTGQPTTIAPTKAPTGLPARNQCAGEGGQGAVGKSLAEPTWSPPQMSAPLDSTAKTPEPKKHASKAKPADAPPRKMARPPRPGKHL